MVLDLAMVALYVDPLGGRAVGDTTRTATAPGRTRQHVQREGDVHPVWV